MKRTITRGLAALAVAAAALIPTQAHADVTTEAYGPNPAQKLDLQYNPRGGARPTLLFIHGGSWTGGDKASLTSRARWFAGQGYTVASMNYRVTPIGWPAQRTDVSAALTWLRANASTYRINPARIALVGMSAGGHIATNVGAYGAGSRTVKAIVAMSPPSDPARVYNDGKAPTAPLARRALKDAVIKLLRCTPAARFKDLACRKRWDGANSLLAAGAGDAPAYLAHSAKDFVPAAHSSAYCAKLVAKGVPCSVRVTTGTAHGSGVFDQVRGDVLAWLRRML